MRVRPLPLLTGTCLAVALATLTLAVLEGGAQGAFVLFVPVLYGTSTLFAVGVGFLLLTFVLLFLTLSWGASQGPPQGAPSGDPHASPQVGGFLLVGPVPIIFGNRQSLWPYLVPLAVATLLAVVLAAVLFSRAG
jgi:uncharacterized membrane protein